MTADKLKSALTAVDWNSNVQDFLKNANAAKELQAANEQIAIWARQLEIIDKGNPALPFVREMQLCGLHVAALIALGLYKTAAGSMRAIFETSLYYSYFRTHHSELASLVRNNDFYMDKQELIEYHKRHTSSFMEMQAALGLLSRLKRWYAELSGVVHGQKPGKWSKHKSLSTIKTVDDGAIAAVGYFTEGVDLAHRLLLCTVGKELWDSVSKDAKKHFLHGLSGDTKKTLGLDAA